jgi:hypothetical protein
MVSPQAVELLVGPVTQAARPLELVAQQAEAEDHEQDPRSGHERQAQYDADQEQNQPDDDPDDANGVM